MAQVSIAALRDVQRLIVRLNAGTDLAALAITADDRVIWTPVVDDMLVRSGLAR